MNISISVPAGTTRLCVYGFDLDLNNNLAGGTFWDQSPAGHDETIFAFYSDPGLTADTSNFLGQFFSDHPVLLSSDGVWRKVVNSAHFSSAQDADGNHNYLLQVTWESELQDVNEANRFMAAVPDPGTIKVHDGTIAGLVGQKTIPEFPGVFPGMVTNFIGDYTSTRVIDEANVCHVDLWEADFDYADDTDNAFTTPTDPPFASDGGVAEGINLGKPPDDKSTPDFNTNLGEVKYTLSVDALALATNTDPSGDREWERYTLCSALSGAEGCPTVPCTETVDTISGTTLTLDIEDWDSRNTIFFRFDVTEQEDTGAHCVVLLDQEAIDNTISTVVAAAASHNVTPQTLINDNSPTHGPNPWLYWNENHAGDIVQLPTGETGLESWFAMPPNPVGKNGAFTLEDFVAGTVAEADLDEVEDVMPMRNQDLASMVGRSCVGVLYDSDVSMNYEPLQGNLQGARLGLFAFKVLALEVAGSLDESGSSTSFYDLWLEVEECEALGAIESLGVDIHDHVVDGVQLTKAECSGTTLTIEATSDSFGSNAIMTTTVDGPDAGSDRTVDPYLTEGAMTWTGSKYQYTEAGANCTDLDGRRLVVQNDHGGARNGTVQ